jgi:hypothetical protein
MVESHRSFTSRSIWHGRLRYSLKTLLLLATVVSLWLGYITHRAKQQKQVVEEILSSGGRVTFAHERMENRADGARMYDPSLQPNVPRWLVRTLGPDYFRKVDSVSIINAPVTDDWLAQLDKLPALDAVTLRGTNVTANGIARLRRLSQLEQLDLQRMTSVTDETLRSIGAALELTHLNLDGCHLVTDEGVQYLAPLTQLKSLLLSHSRITDAGLAHLSRMTKLNSLYLGGTKITDDGLAHLAHLKELYWLDLRGTKVTDAGLQHLLGLTKLWQLVLWDTNVTPEAADRFQAQHSGLSLIPTGPAPPYAK